MNGLPCVREDALKATARILLEHESFMAIPFLRTVNRACGLPLDEENFQSESAEPREIEIAPVRIEHLLTDLRRILVRVPSTKLYNGFSVGRVIGLWEESLQEIRSGKVSGDGPR